MYADKVVRKFRFVRSFCCQHHSKISTEMTSENVSQFSVLTKTCKTRFFIYKVNINYSRYWWRRKRRKSTNGPHDHWNTNKAKWTSDSDSPTLDDDDDDVIFEENITPNDQYSIEYGFDLVIVFLKKQMLYVIDYAWNSTRNNVELIHIGWMMKSLV